MAKRNHHNPDYLKNVTADVIKHGSGPAVPQEHWEVNRNLTPDGTNHWGAAWNPRQGKDRPTMHVKTNECDH